MYTKSPPAYCVYHLPAVHTIIGKPRHIGKYLQQMSRDYVPSDGVKRLVPAFSFSLRYVLSRFSGIFCQYWGLFLALYRSVIAVIAVMTVRR
jgi:hypothetical protein